jgi:hypothetical protein
MCQNWYAVIGQTLDIIGFLTIAFEWYHQYKRDHERRIGELEKAYERNSAELLGQPIPRSRRRPSDVARIPKALSPGMEVETKGILYRGRSGDFRLLVSGTWKLATRLQIVLRSSQTRLGEPWPELHISWRCRSMLLTAASLSVNR